MFSGASPRLELLLEHSFFAGSLCLGVSCVKVFLSMLGLVFSCPRFCFDFARPLCEFETEGFRGSLSPSVSALLLCPSSSSASLAKMAWTACLAASAPNAPLSPIEMFVSAM